MSREAVFLQNLYGDCFDAGRLLELRCVNRHADQAEQKFFSSVEEFLNVTRTQIPEWDYYFGINPRDSRNGTTDAVTHASCVWADLDWKSFEGGQEEAIKRIKNFPLGPTVVVESGNGFHVYWLFKEPEELEDIDSFRRTVKGVQKILGSDKVDDLPRVLRVPGTLNYKDLKHVLPCKIIFAEYSRRYVISDFEPFAISPEEVAKPHKAAAKIEEVIPNGQRNTTLASAAGTMRRRGMIKAEINAALNVMNQDRCRPPLPESEVTKIGGNVSRYPAGKNALLSPGTQPTISIAEILTKAGFDELTEDSSGDDIERAIRNLGHQLEGADQVRRMVAREEAAKLLSVQLKIKGPMALLDPVLKVQDKQTGKRVMDEQVLEPWPEVVNGAELLDEIRGWIGGYVFAPEESINSIALWAVATWFVEFTYFAPLLTLLSPTIQSGKTLVIDLLEWICRETVRTSGVGITPAVIFRLNEKRQPTFLIDEAEKLSGRNADKEIIGLLNEGYRRGGKVQRCGDKSNNFDVEEFEAFGFRLLASTEKLWGSIIDRSIIVRISRKPRSQIMRRFVGRKVRAEGGVLAQKILRFTQDNSTEFEGVQITTPRPQWLADRACDNWSPLFTVAELAGGDWPKKAVNSAKLLCASAEDSDRAEKLIHDTYRIFKDEGWPEVIKSGDLADALNKIESSPWSEYGRGKGITPNKIAAMFRAFEIRPDQRRDSSKKVTRGYWQKDLEDTFNRYIPPSELVQVVQPNKDGGSSDSQSGTEKESCTTSKTPETRTSTESVPLYHSETGDTGGSPSKGDL